MISKSFKKPSKLLYQTEGVRSYLELGHYLHWYHLLSLSQVDLKESAPVIVIPGFLSDDSSTAVLRSVLALKGANVHGWESGVNLGFRTPLFDSVAEHLRELSQKNNQKVVLIGQSLGGVFAKELAKLFPELVEKVISLGSPLMDLSGSSSNISDLYHMMNPDKPDSETPLIEKQFKEHFLEVPEMQMTSIYSKFDGIIHWQASLLPKKNNCQNIEVLGSHCAMAYNPVVINLVLNLLADAPRA